MSKKTWIISGSCLTAVVVAAVIIAFANPFAAPPVAKAATVTAEVGTVTTVVSGKGAIAAAATSNASFVKPGTITGIAVTVGQTVAVGQDLATTDPADADRELNKAQSALSAAESALENARSSYWTASKALDSARAAFAAAPADAPERATLGDAVREQEISLPSRDTEVVAAAKTRDDAAAEVAAAQAARDQTVLKAPMAGVVTAINGTVGSVASGGGSSSDSAGSGSEKPPAGLITISDVSALRVTASIPEADIAKVVLQQTAVVALAASGDAPISGTVISVAPTPQTTTEGVVTYAVTIQLIDPPAGIKLGQTGFVSIATAEAADVVTLPSEAVKLTAPGEGTVQLVVKKGAPAKTVKVKTGLTGNGLAEITDGVSAGDVVEIGSATPSEDPGTEEPVS